MQCWRKDWDCRVSRNCAGSTCSRQIWRRRMVRSGERSRGFGTEKWGSRPGKRAIDVVLLKTLTYSLMTKTNRGPSTMTRELFTTESSCRRHHWCAAKRGCTIHGELAANSKVQIEEKKCHTLQAPLFGAGQGGSQASSAIWQAITTLIFGMSPLTHSLFLVCLSTTIT
jgi:hypothetical protein